MDHPDEGTLALCKPRAGVAYFVRHGAPSQSPFVVVCNAGGPDRDQFA